MKRSMIILGALVALAPLPGTAGAQNGGTLQSLHGSVSWITNDNAAAHPLAPNAQVALSNDDVAQTAAASMGAITLADSSKIMLASNSVLKLDAFSADQVAHAHFVLFYGKMRFEVEHPQGAKADYVFTTPTGAIAVRGTVGDISVDPLDGVRVNVYTASVPVEVSMIDGSQYSVPGGQKIWMRWIDGKLIAKVTGLTKAEVNRFSELGPPNSIDGGAPTQ